MFELIWWMWPTMPLFKLVIGIYAGIAGIMGGISILSGCMNTTGKIEELYNDFRTYFITRFKDHPDAIDYINNDEEFGPVHNSENTYEYAEEQIIEREKKGTINWMEVTYANSNILLLWYTIKERKYPLTLGNVLWLLMFPSMVATVTICYLIPSGVKIGYKLAKWFITLCCKPLKLSRIKLTSTDYRTVKPLSRGNDDEAKPPYAGLFEE